jgi:hypothetical protein
LSALVIELHSVKLGGHTEIHTFLSYLSYSLQIVFIFASENSAIGEIFASENQSDVGNGG